MSPHLPWLWFFIIINIIATLIMLDSNEYIGDLEGQTLNSQSELLLALVLTIASYLIFLGPAYDFISKINVRKINFKANEADLGGRIGKFLVILQLLYLLFNLTTGVNIAGANDKVTDSPFALFFVLLPADTLLIIYYAIYRDNKYFYPNLLIWLLSNLMRGWAGMFIFIIFLEWCRAIQSKKNRVNINFLSKVTLVGLTVILLYPFLQFSKWIVRSFAGEELTLGSFVDDYGSLLESSDYLTMVVDGINQLVGRLQSVSMLTESIRLADTLQAGLAAGEFAPFWKEGLHGIFYDRLFVVEKQLLIGVAFTKYEDFNFTYNIGGWNVSLGYPSWFFIAPTLIPVYLAYTLFLGFISIFLMKKIGMTALSKELVWFTWLVYLMAPWFLTFTGFIYALFVFLILKFVFSNKPFSNQQ